MSLPEHISVKITFTFQRINPHINTGSINQTNVRSQMTTVCVCQAAVMNHGTYRSNYDFQAAVTMCYCVKQRQTHWQRGNEETQNSEVAHTDAFHLLSLEEMRARAHTRTQVSFPRMASGSPWEALELRKGWDVRQHSSNCRDLLTSDS